jgi:hypothetical protein
MTTTYTHNDPAFPIVMSPGTHDQQSWPGVTKLEFLACNAPCQIPDWFKHISPDMEVTPRPSCENMTDEEMQLIHFWHNCNDPLGERLPEHLKWYAVQYTLHAHELAQYNELDRKEKYFQWRRFYAKQLLAELEKQ